MRVFDCGGGYSVQVSRLEVEAFNRSWPCSNLPDASITFCFDSGGDLVDILPYRIADRVDGPEALALCEDAQNYALNHPKKGGHK